MKRVRRLAAGTRVMTAGANQGLTFPGLHPPGIGIPYWSRWKTSLEYRQPDPQESHSEQSLAGSKGETQAWGPESWSFRCDVWHWPQRAGLCAGSHVRAQACLNSWVLTCLASLTLPRHPHLINRDDTFLLSPRAWHTACSASFKLKGLCLCIWWGPNEKCCF